jgi:hypothetical protein
MAGNTGWTNNESLDFDGVSEEPPGPPEDGLYQLTITKAELEPTKDGAPGVGYELHIDRAYDGDPSKIDGKALNLRFQKLTFKKEALFRVLNLSRALDIEPPKTNGAEELTAWAEQLVGRQVWARLKQRVRYNDKTKKDAAVDRFFTEAGVAEAATGAAADATGTVEAAPARRRRAAAG